jgi:hypothetical protein
MENVEFHAGTSISRYVRNYTIHSLSLVQTRRFCKYMYGKSHRRRDLVVFIHDCGNPSKSWCQLCTFAQFVHSHCDVDALLLDIVECRTRPAQWSSLFHVAFPLLMEQLGPGKVSVVTFGCGVTPVLDIAFFSFYRYIFIDPYMTSLRSFDLPCHVFLSRPSPSYNIFRRARMYQLESDDLSVTSETIIELSDSFKMKIVELISTT